MSSKEEWKAMRVGGLLSWLHKFVMLITFPFRRFWQIVLVLLILLIIFLAIPLLQGIKFGDIWTWYMVKMPSHEFVAAKDKTSAKFSQRWRQVKNTIGDMVPNYKIDSKDKEEDKDKFVSWNVAAFRKAKYEPRKNVQIIAPKPAENKTDTALNAVKGWFKSKDREDKKSEDVTPGTLRNATMPVVETPTKLPEPEVVESSPEEFTVAVETYAGNLHDYYIEKPDLDLTYLDEPEKLLATADVLGANSLYINRTFLFLYGIYSDEQKYDVAAAKQYLTDLIGDNQVYCEIVAYTNQTHAATALCFVNGVFINKALVDKYLAANVALK
ncbi:MAG: hypothetical protein J6039_03180 [Alphaproteobacteria bacterium]|nr:hypothetical protein [Alphaproteobacteria bacterium]